ncbi:MAG: spore cortex biosynthesis protein YabQ [Clostridia bacterium]|nr:spore cortex biosynthesis protein YabQ [Clostridia bacterium]
MLLAAIMCGIALGVLYEGIRFVRLIIAPSHRRLCVRWVASQIYTFLTDFLFIIIFAATAILLTNKISGGIFRGIVYVGMGAGFCIYYFVVGKLTRPLIEKIANISKKIIKKLLKLIIIPLRAIFLLIFKLYTLTIGKKLCKIIDSVNKKRVQKQSTAELPELPSAEEKCLEKGYKKEGRISFGGKGIP